MTRKIRVGIIFGGRSGEHEVSLMSARSVMKAINKNKYEVTVIGITKEGKWIAGDDTMKQLTSGDVANASEAALLGEPQHRALMQVKAHAASGGVTLSSMTELDVIFPLLHGTFGEDGTVQGLLELADIPYVGAGVVGSAVGMDKAVFKSVMKAHDIPTPKYVIALRSEVERDVSVVIAKCEAQFGYPMFAKPANLGSSVGVVKAHNKNEMPEALREAAKWDRKILIEQGIDAREIEVSVLGNDEPIASVPGEIVPKKEFYDYNAKYIDGDSELTIPAPLDEATTKRAQQIAVATFKAIDACGMARVDFLMDRNTSELYVSEINTIPGFTEISMYPKLWEASGMSYSELIDRLIELAIERQAEKDATQRVYEVKR
ncbi:MAG: D-alanine--D-alanine ligase [Chloroflexi bacterium]|nr:D-alanine--D-alanine ligase [Chloroflexota bacterium]